MLHQTPADKTKVLSFEQILDWPILELRTLASHLDLDLRRHLFARLRETRRETLRELGVSQQQVAAFSCDASAETQDRLLVSRARELEHIGVLRL